MIVATAMYYRYYNDYVPIRYINIICMNVRTYVIIFFLYNKLILCYYNIVYFIVSNITLSDTRFRGIHDDV